MKKIVLVVMAIMAVPAYFIGDNLLKVYIKQRVNNSIKIYVDNYSQTNDNIWLEKLIYKLRHGNEYEKYLAAYYLGEIGAPSIIALPDLVYGLKNGPHSLRKQSAEAICQIGPKAAEATLDLIKVIKEEPMDDVRYISMHALAEVSDIQDSTAMDFFRDALLSDRYEKMDIEIMMAKINERRKKGNSHD